MNNKPDLELALIQTTLAWHDPAANRRISGRTQCPTMQHRRGDVDGAYQARGMHARPSAAPATFVRHRLRRCRQRRTVGSDRRPAAAGPAPQRHQNSVAAQVPRLTPDSVPTE